MKQKTKTFMMDSKNGLCENISALQGLVIHVHVLALESHFYKTIYCLNYIPTSYQNVLFFINFEFKLFPASNEHNSRVKSFEE